MARHARIDPAGLLKRHFAAEVAEERVRSSRSQPDFAPPSEESDKPPNFERERLRRRTTFDFRDAAVAALFFMVLGLGAASPRGRIGPSLDKTLSAGEGVPRLGAMLTNRLTLARKAFLQEKIPALPRRDTRFRRFR